VNRMEIEEKAVHQTTASRESPETTQQRSQRGRQKRRRETETEVSALEVTRANWGNEMTGSI